MSLDITSNWNIFDKMIFSIEHKMKTILESIHDSSGSEPDVELMIAAETEHLQKENEKLKKREVPVYLVENDGNVLCPKCNTHLGNVTVNYCPNCGHRVIRHVLRQ